MIKELFAELDQNFDLYKSALRAEIPNLLRVRACWNRLEKSWHRCERHLLYGIEVKPREPVRFEVIRNETPLPTQPRGPSSPLKDPEIAELESLAKDLFGASVECSTEWRQAGGQQ